MRFESISESAPLFRELYRNYTEELRSYEPKVPPFNEIEYRREILRNPSLFKFFITDPKEGIVGFIILQKVVQIIRTPAWFIVDFYILPEKRRNGAGTAAFEHFLKAYKGDFFLYILEKNAPAQEFWGTCIKKNELFEVSRPDVPVPENTIIKFIERGKNNDDSR